MPSPELTPADWVNISLTEAMLARDGPPLYVAAKLGCVAAVLLTVLFLLVSVLAFNLLGDGLRDALDPRADRS